MRIKNQEQALAYATEHVERYHGWPHQVELLWIVGEEPNASYAVGVTEGEKRTIYWVGPRGGFNSWLRADSFTAPILARFLR